MPVSAVKTQCLPLAVVTCGHDGAVFGRPFVKRFALCSCYQTVVLFVCDVGVLCQTVGWTKMKLGMQVGLGPATLC